MNSEVEDGEQEILTPAEPADSGTLAILQNAEFNQQIATAKRFPRSISQFVKLAEQLVTRDAETADSCIYAIPRGGKIIEGPSVRFAEAIAYAWGNCRCGARVISEGEEFLIAMGTYADLEANTQVVIEVRRRITNRDGVRFNADMIATTANAASSIALRSATLHGIPKAFWGGPYQKVRKVIAGDTKTLTQRRESAIKHFGVMGVKPEQIFALCDVKGIEDLTDDHLIALRGIGNAIREGEITPERAFARPDSQDAKLAEKSASNLEQIKKRYAQGEKAQSPAEAAPKESPAPPTAESAPAPASVAPAPAAAQEDMPPKPVPPAEPEGAYVPAPPAPEPEPEPPSEPETAIPPLDFGQGKKERKEVKHGTHGR